MQKKHQINSNLVYGKNIKNNILLNKTLGRTPTKRFKSNNITFRSRTKKKTLAGLHIEKDNLMKAIKIPNTEKKILADIPSNKTTLNTNGRCRNLIQIKVLSKNTNPISKCINTMNNGSEKYKLNTDTINNKEVLPSSKEIVSLEKKVDDSVLMGSQESFINMSQSKYPYKNCSENGRKLKFQLRTKPSPFSEIVDDGISVYLGNNNCVANKDKPSNNIYKNS